MKWSWTLSAVFAIALTYFFWPKSSETPEEPDSPHLADAAPPTPTQKSTPTTQTPVTSQLPPADAGRFQEKLALLPREEALKRLSPEELHHTPPQVYGASKVLGQILETLEADPSSLPEAVAFYLTCAKDAQIVEPVKAVCYRNLKHFAPDKAKPNAFDPNVVRLGDGLPPLKFPRPK